MRPIPASQLLVLVPALLTGCGPKRPHEDPTDIRPLEVGGPRLDYPKRGFSVEVPQGWLTGEGDKFVRLQDPKSDPGEYPVTVNILAEPIPAYIRTNQEYIELGIEMMRASFENFRLLGSEPDTIQDTPAIASLFTMSDQGKDLKVLSYAFLAGGRGYIITCRSSADDFPRYRELFAGIAKSIRLH
jgi:hypothetical protein